MGKIKWFVVIIFLVLAFGVGVYFSTEVKNQIENFKKSDVGQTIAQAAKQVLTSSPLNIGGKANNVVLLQSKIIEETNLQRQENGGLVALKENTTLDKVAAAKANDIFVNQYFEHVSPLGVGPGDLAQKYGYEYIIEGENLILGNFTSEKEVVQNWMNSPGHRANILNTRYTEIGVAIIKGTYKGQTVWIGVQEFGLPLLTCEQPNSELKNQIDTSKSQLDVLYSQLTEKRGQIEGTDRHNPTYKQMVEDYNQLVEQYNSLAKDAKIIIAQYNEQVNSFNACVQGK